MTTAPALTNQAPEQPDAGRVLIVTDQPEATPELLAYLRGRAAGPPARFLLLVPNPAAAEAHLLQPMRHDRATQMQQVLRKALPELEVAAGTWLHPALTERLRSLGRPVSTF